MPAPVSLILQYALLTRATQYDWARLELGGLHSSWSVVALLGAYYAVVGCALVALDTAALGNRTGSGASAPLRALLASARARCARARQNAESTDTRPGLCLHNPHRQNKLL